MNSISRSQLAALLLITDIFALICFKGSLSVWMAAGYVFGTAIHLAALLPFASAKSFLKPVKAVFLLYILCFGSITLKRLWDALDVTFIPYEATSGTGGKLLITGIISMVCLYISSTGIKAAARSSVIIAAAGTLFLLIDLASAVIGGNFSNITASADCGTFTDGIVLSLTASGLPVTLLALLPLVKSDKKSALLQYFIIRIAVCTALIFTALLVTGGIMKIADFPVILSAQLSQPFSTQRIDPIFLMLFGISGVFALTAQIMTAAYLVREIFPNFRRWRSIAMITLTVLGAAAAVFMTGCSSTGKVHDKLYLRCIGTDSNNVTMTFFNDDTVLNVECSDIAKAKEMAELEAGRDIVTGFTEMILLGECDTQQLLEYMLKSWKVSPSCLAVYDNTPSDTLMNEDAEKLEEKIKEAIKKGIAPPCGIVDVLQACFSESL